MGKRKPSTMTTEEWQRQQRTDKVYLKLAKRYRAQCEDVQAPCHLCGQGIDYTIPAGEVGSFEVDHFYPVNTHPELFRDSANFRPSHKECNASRGDEPVTPRLGQPSEEW